MKDHVTIKKFPNGITLYLNSEVSFPELLEEIGLKFRESRRFFRDSKMALGFEGRVLTDEEERSIVDTIHGNSDIKIICIVGKDDKTNKRYLKALQKIEMLETENLGKFYRGTLKNNQMLETESSIIILGDIYPGSSVTASKDIIVLGGLYGAAYAGAGGEEGHFIAALEMSPEKMKVGDIRYRPKEKHRWGIKPKVQPKIAYVKENQLVVEPITKELLEFLK